MTAKRLEPHPVGKPYTPTTTSFGDEVENDEINWWVFKQEHDIPTLRKKAGVALRAAQTLKDGAQRIAKSYYQSLKELDVIYEQFAKKYDQEILAVLDFVQWLHTRNELAPSILFNYRTWGSTRMADRTTETQLGDLDNPTVLEKLSLIVLGLFQRELPTSHYVRFELEADFFDSIGPEDYYKGLGEGVSEQKVEKKTAYQAVNEFAIYFAQLRDSLRNVLLDIERRETQERLFTSDDFWRSFILKAALSTKTEQKYWDFKQTLDMWHVKSEPAKSEKANKFAEIIAGFANNQGGVIIVGVTDYSPRQIVGLTGESRDVENYMKYVRSVISQYIPYDKDFVHLQQVNVPDQNGDYKLCLVIAVQQTVDGLGIKGIDGKSYTYPQREETGLVWKEQNTVGNKKIGVKSDNYHFLGVLQQFVNEEV